MSPSFVVPELNTLAWVLRAPDSRRQSDITVAVDDALKYFDAERKAGNYVRSSMDVLRYVATDESIAAEDRYRLDIALQEAESRHKSQLANIALFRRGFRDDSTEKLVGSVDPSQPWLSTLQRPLAVEATAGLAAQTLNYWRSVRAELQDSLGLSLEDLSRILGVSYATIANLGKRKPQGRTIAPITRLHGLVRALAGAEGSDARIWLMGVGRAVLLDRGLGVFEEIVNARVFTKLPTRNAIPLDTESHDGDWISPSAIRERRGERF